MAAENSKCIIWLFLIGATSQVFMAFINKVIAWCAYRKHDKGAEHVSSLVKFVANFENAFIIDVVFDLASLVAFAWSIILIVRLY